MKHHAPARSSLADASAAHAAIALALPMIESACRDRNVCGAGFLCIVVLDPAARPGEVPFEEAVLVEHAVGARSAWDADYAAFARGKAALSWQHQCDSEALQQQRPQLLREGDSLLSGSVVLDGIVVAVSGAMPWWDQAFATTVAANLRAIAKARHAAAREAGLLVAGTPNADAGRRFTDPLTT